MLKRFIPFVLAAATLTACTPAQIAEWVAWNERDPVAAQEFAQLPEIQASLAAGAAKQAPAPRQTGDSVWDRLAQCESGGAGATTAAPATTVGCSSIPASWRAYGGRDFAEFAWQASRGEQIIVAERVLDDVGWGAWPACSRRLGLR